MATATKKLNAATAGDLSAQIETLRRDVTSLIQMIANSGRAVGGEAVSTAGAKATDQRESAKYSAATARLQAVQWQDVAHDF